MAFPHDGKKFKPGESGNLKGAPRRLPELTKIIDEVLGEEKDGVTAMQAIVMALRKKAAAGDVRAAELLIDRSYGKQKSSVDLTTNGKDIPPPVIDYSLLSNEVLQAIENASTTKSTD